MKQLQQIMNERGSKIAAVIGSGEVAAVNILVQRVREASDDPEAAHLLEDSLAWTVLETIAEGRANGAELARAALESRKIDFPRRT